MNGGLKDFPQCLAKSRKTRKQCLNPSVVSSGFCAIHERAKANGWKVVIYYEPDDKKTEAK